ncbi:MAG: diguanylate cyclase [Pseudomonadota bacterium]
MAKKQNDRAELPYSALAAEFTRDALMLTDTNDRVVWINDGFERLTGFSLRDMLGKLPGDVLRGEHTVEADQQRIDNDIANLRSLEIEMQYRRKDNTPVWIQSVISPVFDENGKHIHFVSSSRDVTERRALERATSEATENEQLRQTERKLLSQVSEWLYSAKSLDELLQVISRSLETLMPEAEGQLYIYSNSRDTLDLTISWGGDKAPATHIEPDDCWALRRGRAYSYGMRPIEFPCGHSHATEDDSPYFCVPITAHGQTNGLLHLNFGNFAPDRAEREKFKYFLDQRWELALLCAEQISLAIANVQLRQELLDQSVRDPLTNLWNRRWFLDAAHRQIHVSKATRKPCSVISVDVDHFKQFNDHHGHDAGDLVLRALGARMLEFFTGNCAPCRMGGEEFIILCSGISETETRQLAEEFRQQISDIIIKYSGAELPRITVSAGVAMWTENCEHVAELIKAADLALYRAKELGRNRVESYSEMAA